MPLDYQDYSGPDGQSDNPGGGAGFIYFAPKRDFTTITKPLGIATASTLGELALNSTDFVFTGTKGWLKMYITFDTGEVEWTRQGELDGYSMVGKAKGFVPGINAEVLGMLRIMKNDRFVVLFPTASTADDSTYIQLGDDFFDCYLSASKMGTATNSKGRRGSELDLMVQCSGPYLYDGAIVLAV